MNRAGMTLLEMLLSLALLSAIIAATASWTQITVMLVSPNGPVERQQWHNAANSVFDLIEQDLQCGDFEIPDKSSGAKIENPQITITVGRLTIRTRSTVSTAPPGNGSAPAPRMGAVIHEYRFDSDAGQLQLIEYPGAGSGGGGGGGGRNAKQARPLLDLVKSWQCQAKDKHFDVSIETSFGETLQRRYRLP